MDLYDILKDKDLFSDREARVCSAIVFMNHNKVTKDTVEKMSLELGITPKTVENAVKKMSSLGMIEYHKEFEFVEKIDEVSIIIDHINKKMKKRFSKISQATRKPINDRLAEGYTTDELIETFDKLLEWTEGISDLLKYLKPETTFNTDFYKRYDAYKENRDYYQYAKAKLKQKQQGSRTNNQNQQQTIQQVPTFDLEETWMSMAKSELGWANKQEFTRDEMKTLIAKKEEIKGR